MRLPETLIESCFKDTPSSDTPKLVMFEISQIEDATRSHPFCSDFFFELSLVLIDSPLHVVRRSKKILACLIQDACVRVPGASTKSFLPQICLDRFTIFDFPTMRLNGYGFPAYEGG